MSVDTTEVLQRCQAALPRWRELAHSDFKFDAPKGFSSFTMGVRTQVSASPPAVLYRHLEGKDNPMLDFEDEREVYESLANAGIAAPLHAYDRIHRIEAFYEGRTLTRHDLTDHNILRKIGEQLARLHNLSPRIPAEPFFERLHHRWGVSARRILVDERHQFPDNEQAMCEELLPLLESSILDRVRALLPDEPLGFRHNDTYHGNIMLLKTGEVRLLDFEFSCLNYRAFDLSNLFAETVMRHKLPDYPFFGVADPEYTANDVGAVVEGYLNASNERGLSADALVDQTLRMIPLSDFMYAMASLPLALDPIQHIRFIPYALRRFQRFLSA